MTHSYAAGYRDGRAAERAQNVAAMREFAAYNVARYGEEKSAVALLRQFADMIESGAFEEVAGKA
jgi:hypothetical protein